MNPDMAIGFRRICLDNDETPVGRKVLEGSIEGPELGTALTCRADNFLPTRNGSLTNLVASKSPEKRASRAATAAMSLALSPEFVNRADPECI
jgi:hypothetical protein